MSYQVIEGPAVHNQQGYQVIGGSPAGYQVISSQPQGIQNNTPQPQPTSSPSYRQRWQNVRQSSENLGKGAYDWSRQGFGIDPNAPRASWTETNAMKSNFKASAGSALDPRGFGGLANYGLAGIGGVMDFANKTNAGMDFDDAAGQALGRTAGSLGGGAIGAGIGSAAAIPLAMIPVVGPILAASAPLVGGYFGSKWGGYAGDAIGGGIVDVFDRDNDFTRGNSQQKQLDQLGKYAQFLSPDEQQNLANYLSLSDAQSQIDQKNALFSAQLAKDQFDHESKVRLQNDMMMNTLQNRAAMEQAKQQREYDMAINSSNNLWQGLGMIGNMYS